jgi:hypothetical protein
MTECKSQKVQGMLLLRLLEYKFGRPAQQAPEDAIASKSVIEKLQNARQRTRKYEKSKEETTAISATPESTTIQ